MRWSFVRFGRSLVTVGLAGLLLLPASAETVACEMPPPPETLTAALVTRVVDGDTLWVVLHRGAERVRLLGIDTPEVFDGERLDRDARDRGRTREEIRALGRLSTEYTRRYLDGVDVGLEFDVQERDRFGRLLAYVWLPEISALFNLQIVRDGYAQVLTVPPNVKYADLLLACQREARQHNRGLWGR